MKIKIDLSIKGSISLSANSKQGISELEALITRASNSYYNHNKFIKVDIRKEYPEAWVLLDQYVDLPPGRETMDDANFDVLWDLLTEIRPTSKVLKKTGAPATGKGKTKLPYPMNGLDQIRPDTADAWLATHPGPYVVSNKMDGISFEQVCGPTSSSAYTKGDSDIGNDISHMLPHLRVPQPKRDVAVRAEMIIKVSVFEAKHAKSLKTEGKKYENARNMAAGVTNPKRRDIHESVGDVDVVAYEVLKPTLKPSEQFKLLKKLGYSVAPYRVYESLTGSQLMEILALRKKKSLYELDGLVVAQDRIYPSPGESNPKHAVKFKYNTADSMVDVKVIDVIWTGSKHDKLKPRVKIEPTRLAGVTIDYCTGFNAFFVANGFLKTDKTNPKVRPIGPGAIVRLTRSGDVIPHIVKVLKGARVAAMPDVAYEWTSSGIDIVQSVKTDLSAMKRIAYFFSKLKVEGLKMGTVNKLYNAGFDTILKIVRAPKSAYLDIEGIQEKTAEKLTANIKKALGAMTLPALMDASGKFGQGMGEKRLLPLVKANPTLMTEEFGNAQLFDMAMATAGFSTKLATQFASGFPMFKKFYKLLGIDVKPLLVKKPKGSKLAGKTFVFTGFRDALLEAKITEQGGAVGGAINKNTSMLVVKDLGSSSSKTEKARALGIKIVSGSGLSQLLNSL